MNYTILLKLELQIFKIIDSVIVNYFLHFDLKYYVILNTLICGFYFH